MGGSSLAPEVFRRSYGQTRGRPAPARARLDRAGCRSLAVERAIDLAQDAVHRLHQVRRDDRDDLAVRALPRAPGATAVALRGDHRPGQPRWRAGRGARLPPRVPQRPGHRRPLLGAVVLRARAGGAGGRRHPGRCSRRAQVAEQRCSDFDPEGNSGLWLGLALGELALRRPRQARRSWSTSRSRRSALWAEQLIAESTGKQGRGILPVADEPLGDAGRLRRRPRVPAPAQHRRARRRPRRRRSPRSPRPATRRSPSQARGPDDLGRVFFFAEFATAVAGWVLGINPFDQPNVQEAKDNTAEGARRGRAGGGSSRRPRRRCYARPSSRRATSRSWATCRTRDEVDAAIARLRATLIAATPGVATTFGYGPRFLHSTGQFHKGGPPVGRFLQLVHDVDARRRRPGRRLRLPHARSRAGRRRPADAARPRPAGRARAPRTPGTSPGPSTPLKEVL